MRRIGKLPPPPVAGGSAVFSTFSGGGGRGRGRGSTVPPPPPSQSPPDPTGDGGDHFASGAGHGRGSHPPLPSFPSFLSPSPLGRGRGTPPPETLDKKPIFFRQDESPPENRNKTLAQSDKPSKFSDPGEETPRPLPALPSAGGRGQPLRSSAVPEPNRHIRQQKPLGAPVAGPAQPKMNREDAVKKAMEVLSRGRGGPGGPPEGGRGMRGMRGRGRGGRGMGRGRGGRDKEEEEEEYLGDPADLERFTKRIGEEKFKLLEEAFDEMSWRVLPPPLLEEYYNAWDTNNMVI